MKINMFAIRDSKTMVFGNPIFSVNDQTMMRAIINISLDEEHPIGKNPEDYDLYKLGTFDDNSGKCELLDSPEHLQKVLVMRDQFIAARKNAEKECE